MVGTIVPMVHEERLDGGHTLSTWLHMLGCVIGSIGMGALLGVAGALIPWSLVGYNYEIAVLIGMSLVSLTYGIRELGLLKIPCPQLRCQVPVQWRYSMPRRVAALLYGVVLGFGFATRIPVGTLYAAAAWVFLKGDPLLGAVLMSPFGIGRTIPLILIARTGGAYDETFQVNQFLRIWEPVVKIANGALLGFVAAYLFWSRILY